MATAKVGDKRTFDTCLSYTLYEPPAPLATFLPFGCQPSADMEEEFKRLWRERQTQKRVKFQPEPEGSTIPDIVVAERIAMELCVFDQPPNPQGPSSHYEPEPEPPKPQSMKRVTFGTVEAIPIPAFDEDCSVPVVLFATRTAYNGIQFMYQVMS